MGKKVFADGNAIACKKGDAKVIASFPDVCLSPPAPPAGPIPVPYPNSSFSKDMSNGSKTVQIGGGALMLRDKSFYKTSPLGNEAATRSFGANPVSHVITGKTYFAAWSMDVKVEGKNVDRHLDITTSNHGSFPPGAATPNPDGETVDPEDEELKECPCCKGPLHENQRDPATGKAYKRVKEENWYQKGVDPHNAKVARMNEAIARDPAIQLTQGHQISETLRKQKDAQNAMNTIKASRNRRPPCPNLHDPQDSGCGTHLAKTNPKPNTSDEKWRRRAGFTDGVKNECVRQAKARGMPATFGSEIIHKTPLTAGGCPNDQKNLIPKNGLSPECQGLDDAQTSLQSLASQTWAS